MARSLLLPLILLAASVAAVAAATAPSPPASKDVSSDSPVVQFTVPPSSAASCERVRVLGLSRLVDLPHYADSRVVALKTEGFQGKAEICVHRNASIGLCQCEKEKWQAVQKGTWSMEVSPYDNRVVDVRWGNKTSGTVTVSIDQGLERWRLVCLGIGFILLLSSPIVSSWAPFYYSSSMTLGVLLLVLIIFFQGMKLLPLGRKNVLYITVFGSLVGVGTLLVDYFSALVNSVLLNLGIDDEMHNPVSVFLLVGIVLAGAALGHWIVRKYILSEDGRVDTGVAQFVRWAMRFIAAVFISQSTMDPLLALLTLCTSAIICYLLTSRKWWNPVTQHQTHLNSGTLWPQKTRQGSAGRRHAEFLSPPRNNLGRTVRQSPNEAYGFSNSPLKGPVLSIANKKPAYEDGAYYSSFHKTLTPRRFSKKEWDDFTHESTSEALQEWASSPEVGSWIAENHKKIQLVKHDNSDDSTDSSSGSSSEETDVENSSGLNLFRWR